MEVKISATSPIVGVSIVGAGAKARWGGGGSTGDIEILNGINY